MSLVGWTLFGLAWLFFGVLSLWWIRWNTRLPLPGRQQDVRSIVWRARQYEIDDALDQALSSARFETLAGSEASRR